MEIRHDARISRHSVGQAFQKRRRIGIEDLQVASLHGFAFCLQLRKIAAGILEEGELAGIRAPFQKFRTQKPLVRIRTFIDAEAFRIDMVKQILDSLFRSIFAFIDLCKLVGNENIGLDARIDDRLRLPHLILRIFGYVPRGYDSDVLRRILNHESGKFKTFPGIQLKHLA